MDILKPFKAIREKVKAKVEEKQQEQQDQIKLQQWKEKLSTALTPHETFRAKCATNDSLYHGTKEIRAVGEDSLYMSSIYQDSDAGQTADARQVVNIVFQLIESQIDVNMPVPAVSPREEEDDGERRDMIEGKLTYMVENVEMRRMNTENERIAKKNGMAWFKVRFDPSFKAHSYVGRIDTKNPHPVNIITQPDVFRVSEMDYMFHLENRTLNHVCREYGEEFREILQDESPEYAWLDKFDSYEQTTTSSNKGILSVVECWYKDKDGDVGVITWVRDTILRDQPKFFYKRDESGQIMEYEEIEVEGVGMVQVRCHVPDRFPFIPLYNIPLEKSIRGKADPEIIFDQQEGIKKMLSIEEEKQVQGTTKIITRKGSGLAGKITNATMQVLETDEPSQDVVAIDLKTPSQGANDLYGIYLQAAKDALGVTEASQGRAESTTLSGRALEQLSAQTAGRMQTKKEEKDIAYTELFRLWYDFLLAYADDPVPYRGKGKDNKPVFGYWDKSKLVKQDAAGEWYYPEPDINIQAETAMMKDQRFVLDLMQNAGPRLDNVGYWMLAESIGIPNATAILDMEQKKAMAPPPTPPNTGGDMPVDPTAAVEQPQPAGMDPAAIIAQLPPEQQQIFNSLPPEQQQALIQQAMQGGPAQM